MGDGRTDLFRNMWTRTTTNDTGMVDTTPFSKKIADQYPIGASLEEQAKYTDWPEKDARRKALMDLYDLEHMPDQRMHRIVSFVKSGFRIVGAFAGMFGYIPAAFGLFFLAEVVGIYEELV